MLGSAFIHRQTLRRTISRAVRASGEVLSGLVSRPAADGADKRLLGPDEDNEDVAAEQVRVRHVTHLGLARRAYGCLHAYKP